MKIVFFNRFCYPDASATSQMLSDLVFHLAAEGMSVHVVTSLSDPSLAREEVVHGVTIHRVANSRKAATLARKAMEYIAYYLGARKAARRLLERGDVAVFKTDPPMLLPAVGPVAQRNGAIIVNWLQDLFPEVAQEHGVVGARFAPIRSLRNEWLRRAAANVAISDAMKARVTTEAGLAPGKVHVIHNWAKGSEIAAVGAGADGMRAEWQLEDRFIVGYSGNLGRVHEFDTLLDAAAELQGHDEIAFLIIGTGPRAAEVQAKVRERGLANVRFQPPRPRSSLGESLALPDVHLTTLKPRFEALVVPSKIYGVMAAGRPCIYIGDPNGDPAQILERDHAGVAVATGDGAGLARAILGLKADPVGRARMGANARALFEREFDFPIAARRWTELLKQLG